MHIPLSRGGLAFGLLVASCQAQQDDLTELNLDDLAQVQVTSVSRKSESLTSAPAAIYVLTGETIHQDGFTTLVDALRVIPALYVAQMGTLTRIEA